MPASTFKECRNGRKQHGDSVLNPPASHRIDLKCIGLLTVYRGVFCIGLIRDFQPKLKSKCCVLLTKSRNMHVSVDQRLWIAPRWVNGDLIDGWTNGLVLGALRNAAFSIFYNHFFHGPVMCQRRAASIGRGCFILRGFVPLMCHSQVTVSLLPHLCVISRTVRLLNNRPYY